MSSNIELRIVTRAELEKGQPDWNDPDGLALMHANKVKTLINNPHCRPADPVQIVGLLNGRAIGQINVLFGLLNIKGRIERVLFASSLYVPPAFRYTGVGLMLIMEVQQLHRTIAVCGASQAVLPIYERLKWTRFSMPRMMLLRKSRSALQTKLSNPMLLGLARRLVDLGLALQRGLLFTCSRRKELVVKEIKEVPERWNEQLCPTDKISEVRSSEWYAWLLANQFNEDASLKRKLYVVEDTQGRTLGFFLLRTHFYPIASRFKLRDLTIGSLQDWMSFDQDKLGTFELVLEAVRCLDRDGVDVVEIVMPEAQTQCRLRRRGLLQAGGLDFLFKAKKESPLSDKVLHNSQEWLLRPAYSDNFFS